MKNAFGKLQDLYNDADVMEIIIDQHDDIYWEKAGKTYESDSLLKSEDDIKDIAANLLKSVGRNFTDINEGFADIRLQDGTRVAITTSPIALNGTSMVIRKMPKKEIDLDDMIKFNVLTSDAKKILEKLMLTGKNVILAGNAGSGKTTMANQLIKAIDPSWRVVCIEKTAELLTNRKRTLRLETPNAKKNEMQELIKKASLLRADTFVINELVGSETFDALNLMREGYSVLATMMSEGVYDALKKAELFCLMGQYGFGVNEIKYHVSSAVDAVIYQERLADGRRVLSNISLVNGIDENGKYKTIPLFTYDDETDEFIFTQSGMDFIK
mgnify:CR=1 FL=1